jgi:hypothetical protein
VRGCSCPFPGVEGGRRSTAGLQGFEVVQLHPTEPRGVVFSRPDSAAQQPRWKPVTLLLLLLLQMLEALLDEKGYYKAAVA